MSLCVMRTVYPDCGVFLSAASSPSVWVGHAASCLLTSNIAFTKFPQAKLLVDV